MTVRAPLALIAAVALWGCGSGPRRVSGPPPSSAGPVETLASAAPIATVALLEPVTVPHVDTAELPGEIHVSVSSRPTTLVELRVLVGSGTAADGAHPSMAEVAAKLVARTYAKEAKADPRAAPAIATKVEPDSVAFVASIPPDGVSPTLTALGRAISKPATDVESMKKTSAEVIENAGQRARNIDTAGLRFSIRDLYLAPIGRHPYSITVPSTDDVRGIDEKSVRSYFETHYVTRNLSVIAVGPVTADKVSAATTDSFAKLSAGVVAPLTLDPPDARPRPLKVMLIDEPKRDPVLISVARLAPSIADGSASATRLFGAISADRLRAKAGGESGYRLAPFRGGPSVGILWAHVPAAHVKEVVSYFRGEGEAWSKDPTAEELVSAKNEITGELGRTVDSPAVFADTLREALSVGAPETIVEREAFEIGTTGATDVTAAAHDALTKDQIVVIVGDASAIGEPLSHLGEVDVLDPLQGFVRLRSIQKSAPAESAPIPPPAP